MRGLNNMKLVSWNVQNGTDAYGNERTTEQIDYLLEQDAEVIALQEADETFLAGIEQRLCDYHWCFAPALSFYKNNQLKQFGNLVGAKKGSVLQWRSHCLLPTPTTAAKHMPRSVGELVVHFKGTSIRVITCHLEFHCEKSRRHQINQICNIIDAAKTLTYSPCGATEGLYKPIPLPIDAVICGDFNIPDDSIEYQQQIVAQTKWRDLALPNAEPTCGIYDTHQWESGPDRRDYFFTNSHTLQGQVRCDTQTSLSDHQPIVLHIETL
jgi:endonuclease/exonuclease/phosphatase family metal-dependent hydrolase